MNARSIAAGAAALLLALVLGACSDDTNLTGNQRQAISDFRAGANSVCASSNQQKLALRSEYLSRFGGKTPTAEQAHDFLVSVWLPLFDSSVGALHNLGEPTLNRTDWDDIMRQVDATLSNAHSEAEQDPIASLEAFATPDTVTTNLDNAFTKFGAEECAKNI